MFEAQQPSAAARRYRQRIVAHETNSRSSPALKEAFRKMGEELVGGLYTARDLCFKWRDTIGRTPLEPVPPGVQYHLCLGPTPKGEFTRSRFHYNWHWFRDCGNGDPGNQGIHDVDAARWGLGVTHPCKVSWMGGHFKFDDEQETPNTLTALFEFDAAGKKKLMVFEVRHWIPNHEGGIGVGSKKKGANTIGTIFYPSKGSLVVECYTMYYTFLGREPEPGPGCQEGGNNRADFVSAVRSRRASDLSATLGTAPFPTRWCTGRTFRTGSGGRSHSMRRSLSASATRKPTGCSRIATASRSRRRESPDQSAPVACRHSASGQGCPGHRGAGERARGGLPIPL